jgi:transcriptional regulator GlxA family with amidase domain
VEGVDLQGSAMTNRSPDAVRSLVALRRLARGLRGVGLPAAWVAGVGAAGAAVSLRKAYPRAPQAVLAEGWPQDVDAGLAPEPDVVVVPAVAAPNGTKEAPLHEWITRRSDQGAHLLGVCNGSRLLAATGLLDGRRATAHWSSIRSLARSRPQVDWVRGQRYVQDGTLTTTAGVTSGVFGALRLVEQLAGAAEAQRVGQELAYPGWSLHGPTEIRGSASTRCWVTWPATATRPPPGSPPSPSNTPPSSSSWPAPAGRGGPPP